MSVRLKSVFTRNGSQEQKRLRTLTRLHMEACDVPLKYWRVSLNAVPNDAPYKKVVERYIEKIDELVPKGKGLLLWGPNRHGKTSLAVVILKEVLRRGYDAHFVRAADLVDAVMQHKMVDEELSVSESVRKTALLVIDDLGKELWTRSAIGEAVIDNVVRARESDLRATIVTTNVPEKEQAEVFKPSMMALMKECMVPVKVWAKDYSIEESARLERVVRGD